MDGVERQLGGGLGVVGCSSLFYLGVFEVDGREAWSGCIRLTLVPCRALRPMTVAAHPAASGTPGGDLSACRVALRSRPLWGLGGWLP